VEGIGTVPTANKDTSRAATRKRLRIAHAF
jgi:hypothetical protein